jgi:membrane protein DedA with SNARE-associated domain
VSHTINDLVQHYGAIGVFLAAVAEGEIGVLVGGAMAHLGKLNPVAVALAGWSGSFLSTEAFFHIGRSQRDGRWVAHVRHRRTFAKAMEWIERRPRLFCFGFRFVYGFRVVGPVGISLSGVDSRTFAIINLVSALVWGIGATMLGWWAGPAVVAWMGKWFDWHDLLIAGAVVLAALLLFILWRSVRPSAPAEQAHPTGD